MSGFGMTGVNHESTEQTFLQRMYALVRLEEAHRHVTELLNIVLP